MGRYTKQVKTILGFIIYKNIMRLIVFALIVLYSVNLYSNENYRFVTIDYEKGLSFNCVICIEKDSVGYMWFGTKMGLNRYDGRTIKTFFENNTDSSSLINNDITCLHVDQKGCLWIGTVKGVSKFNYEKENFENFYIDSSLNYLEYVNDICHDQNNNIWVGTHHGLVIINDSTNHTMHYTEEDSLILHNQISSLEKDKNGNIWIGYKENGISIYDTFSKKTRHLQYQTDKDYILKNVKDFCFDEYNVLIGTIENDLIIYDKRKSNFKNLNIVKNEIKLINKIINADGGYMVSTLYGMLHLDHNFQIKTTYKNSADDPYSISPGIPSDLYLDNQNILWVGNMSYGVNKSLPRYGISVESDNNTLSEKHVKCFAVDKNKLWIGYAAGGLDLLEFNKGKINNITTNDIISETRSDCINDLFIDSKNNLWIGTYKNGLGKYNLQTGEYVKYLHNPNDSLSISGNDIRGISEDSYGRIWITVHGKGVDILNTKKDEFTHIHTEKPGKTIIGKWGYSVAHIYNYILVGTTEGLLVFNERQLTTDIYQNIQGNQHSLSVNYINCILQDSNGNVWIGTKKGLDLFDLQKGIFKRVKLPINLPTNNILGIIEDRNGFIWITSYAGISKFKYDKIPEKLTHVYTLSNINGLITTGFESDEIAINNDDELFFASDMGIIHFNTNELKKNTFQPKTVISDFKINSISMIVNSEVQQINPNYTNNIDLKYNQNNLTFVFASLSFIDPKKNQYSYQLNRSNENGKWNNIGTKDELVLAHIQPGTYELKVKSSNNDNVWSKEPISVKFTVHPPFLKSRKAFIIYLLLTLSALLVLRIIGRKREKMQRKMELESYRNRIFTNLSHDFKTPLTLIINPLEKIINNFGNFDFRNNRMTFQMMYSNSRRLLRLINQIIDMRRIDTNEIKVCYLKTDIVSFIHDIYTSFIELSESKKINYSFNTTEKELQAYIDPDIIDKVLFNIISNAFKYTEKNGTISVEVRIGYENITIKKKQSIEKNIEIIVKDTGFGIPEEERQNIFKRFYSVSQNNTSYDLSTGIGLSLSKELIEKVKGKIMLDSNQDGENNNQKAGSRFIIKVPLIRENKGNLPLRSAYLPKKKKQIIDSHLFHDPQNMESSILSNVKDKTIILIAEDNTELRDYMKIELSSKYKMLTAENGKIAFEMTKKHMPDIVISDIMMPEMNGYELVNKIKSIKELNHIYTILLSAKTDKESVLDGYDKGADDYLKKPFSIEVLESKLRNFIQYRKVYQHFLTQKMNLLSIEHDIVNEDEVFLKKMIDLIKENLSDEEFNVERLAAMLNLSRAQLFRKVQALTNQTIGNIIKSIKMTYAAELIKTNKNLTFTEISIKIGFSSLSNFTRAFTQYYNMSPKRYAENHD